MISMNHEERIGQTRWMIEHARERSLDELLKEVKSQKSGRRSMLSGSNERDVAILFGRKNGLFLGEMDELLEEYGFPTLVPPLK